MIIEEPVRGTFGDMSFLRLPGIEAVRHLVHGDGPLPPIHHLTGIRPTEAGLGKVTATMPVTGWFEDAFGIVWSNIYSFFADLPISLALYAGLPAGKFLTTSELSIHYLRPATRESGHLIARAQPVYLGTQVGVSEVTIEDRVGRTMAHATTRCVVIDVPFDPDADLPSREEPIEDPPDPYLREVPEGHVQSLELIDGDRLALLERFITGDLPPAPFQLLMGAGYEEVADGAVTLTWPATPWLSAGGPTMYGGAIAYACDTALTTALSASVDSGALIAPLDLQVRFLRPAFLDGSTLTVRGEARHRGRTVRTGYAEVVNADGKRVAVATGSGMVIHDGLERLRLGHKAEHIVGIES